jgi:hypothetical protein
VTGRFALYQADATPFIHRWPTYHMPAVWWESWWWRPGRPDSARGGNAWQPEIGSRYYEDVLAGGRCSPSGILAAPVPPGRQPLTSVPESSTWPWEFDTYEWLRRASPLDRSSPDGERQGLGESAPDFEPYLPTDAQAPTPENATEMASQLARQLRLPSSARLYLVMLA